MSVRRRLLFVHRWMGVALAGFVVLAGATGSLLAFHHEIDEALVPELHRVTPREARASFDDAAGRIEARHPQLVVGYFVMHPGKSWRAVLNTRAAAEAGRLDRGGADSLEVYIDPHTGRLLGERRWGEFGATRAHLVPMVYRLHMSLFLGKAGQWITGVVAALWIAAIVVGVILAVPRLRVLRKAFRVKWTASRTRLFFDAHRAFGITAAVLLIVAAFTGLYMNLPQVVEPAVAAISPFTERPASSRGPGAPRAESWKVGWDEAYRSARGIEPCHPAVVFGRVEARGYYQIRFMPPDDIVDAGTIRVFVDGGDGRVLGRFEDRKGTAADLIRIWQFPLHSGQGFGLPGRLLVCILGFVPLLLAFTGLWLWLHRQRMRRRSPARPPAPLRETA